MNQKEDEKDERGISMMMMKKKNKKKLGMRMRMRPIESVKLNEIKIIRRNSLPLCVPPDPDHQQSKSEKKRRKSVGDRDRDRRQRRKGSNSSDVSNGSDTNDDDDRTESSVFVDDILFKDINDGKEKKVIRICLKWCRKVIEGCWSISFLSFGMLLLITVFTWLLNYGIGARRLNVLSESNVKNHRAYMNLKLMNDVTKTFSEVPLVIRSIVDNLYYFERGVGDFVKDYDGTVVEMRKLMRREISKMSNKMDISVLLGDINGKAIGVSYINKTYVGMNYMLINETGWIKMDVIDENGNNVVSSPFQFPYDPRIREWFIDGMLLNENESAWSNIYINIVTGELTISFLAPVFNQSGNRNGVINALIGLDSLSTNIQGKDHEELIYVVDERNNIISSNVDDGIFEKFFTPKTHANQLIRKSASKIEEVYGNFSMIPYVTESVIEFVCDRKDYFVDVKVYEDTYGMRVIFVVTYAVSLIYQSKRILRVFSYISIVSNIVLYIFIFVLFITAVIYPIKSISKIMRDLASLSSAKKFPRMMNFFKFKEINEIVISSKILNRRFHDFKKFLPRDVLLNVLGNKGYHQSMSSIQCQVAITPSTVFFADINGFTNYSESHTSKEIIDLLSSFFAIAERCVVSHSGIIDKFIGDCVMCIFCEKFGAVNHEKSAVAAAISMNYQCKNLDEPIKLHFGINTSESNLLGFIGSKNRVSFTSLGDASRLEGLNNCYNSEILIGSNTFKIVRSSFLCLWIDKLKLRGKNDEIDIYEVMFELTEKISKRTKKCVERGEILKAIRYLRSKYRKVEIEEESQIKFLLNRLLERSKSNTTFGSPLRYRRYNSVKKLE